MTINDVKDENKFPSKAREQLNNYIEEIYGQYRTELIATSVLRFFTKNDLMYLCQKIGKNLNGPGFISYRSSGLLEEDKWSSQVTFVAKDIIRPLIIDIYESLLDDSERYNYNRILIDYHLDKESLHSQQSIVFHVNMALEYAQPSAKLELLKAKMIALLRMSLYEFSSGAWYNYDSTLEYCSEAYETACELHKLQKNLSAHDFVTPSVLKKIAKARYYLMIGMDHRAIDILSRLMQPDVSQI